MRPADAISADARTPRHTEPRAAEIRTADRDGAAVPLDDALHDGEAEPVAGFATDRIVVELHEGIEDAIAIALGNSRAVVVNAQLEDLVPTSTKRYANVTVRIAGRVVEQVA